MKRKHDLTITSSVLYLLLAGAILVFAMGYRVDHPNPLIGKVTYDPVQVYGEIYPDLPDGTQIDFKVGRIVLASTYLTNNSFGYNSELFFALDNQITPAIEGYSEGDVVDVYIENIKVAEFSYFDPWGTEKNINIPAGIRADVANKAALADIGRRCNTKWSCKDWSKCSEGIKTRECIDLNECGLEVGRPTELMECSRSPTVEAALSTADDVLSMEAIVLLSLILVLLIYVVVLVRRGRIDDSENHSD